MATRTNLIPVSYDQSNRQLPEDSRYGEWVRYEFRRGAILLPMALASWVFVTGLGWGLLVLVRAALNAF